MMGFFLIGLSCLLFGVVLGIIGANVFAKNEVVKSEGFSISKLPKEKCAFCSRDARWEYEGSVICNTCHDRKLGLE